MNTKKSSCADVLDRLPLYVGGELDPSDAELVLAHIGHCAPCAGEEQTVERAQAAFGAALRAPVAEIADPDLWSGVQARLIAEGLIGERAAPGALSVGRVAPIRALGAGRREPRFRLLRRIGGVAAAAALLAVASRVGLDLQGDPGSHGPVGLDGVAAPAGGPGPLVAGPTPFDVPTSLVRNELEEKMQPVGLGEISLTKDAVLFVPRLSVRNPPHGVHGLGAGGASSLAGNSGRLEVELR